MAVSLPLSKRCCRSSRWIASWRSLTTDRCATLCGVILQTSPTPPDSQYRPEVPATSSGRRFSKSSYSSTASNISLERINSAMKATCFYSRTSCRLFGRRPTTSIASKIWLRSWRSTNIATSHSISIRTVLKTWRRVSEAPIDLSKPTPKSTSCECQRDAEGWLGLDSIWLKSQHLIHEPMIKHLLTI